MSNTYTVKTGDTFSSISRSKFGSEKKASVISQANPEASAPLIAGSVLTIPGTSDQQVFKNSGLDIKVGGLSVTAAEGFVISSAIDGFRKVQFTLPNEMETREICPMLQPTAVDVGYNGRQIFSGYMPKPEPSHSDNKKQLNISADSWPNLLMQPPPATAFPLEFIKVGIDKIANALLEPYALEYFFYSDQGPVFPKAEIKQSGPVLDFLSGLCKQRARIIRDDEFGSVVFDNGALVGDSVLHVDDEARPDIDVSIVVNPAEWYSHITGILKGKNKRKSKRITYRNDFYRGILRPHEFEITDSDEGELETALYSVAGRMFASVFKVTLIVPSWTDKNGDVFQVGRPMTVRSQKNYIKNFSEFLIDTVTLSNTSSGDNGVRTAVLTGVIPGSYGGNVPKEIPWI